MAGLQDLKEAHEDALLALDGVEGVGLGEEDDGRPAIVVYVSSLTPELRQAVQRELPGVPVRFVVSGEFSAQS